MDNRNIILFKKIGDQEYQKAISLAGAQTHIETLDESGQQKDFRWTERTETHRVVIQLPKRDFRPLFFYSKDVDEVKCIKARVTAISKGLEL